jgi:ABC-type antimicrobial peptide transport system permease subunit
MRAIRTCERPEMSLVRERLLALLATFFGALALLLACIGLYGVMAYRVARRTREIGIRIAIGASARQQSVVWMMVREMLLLVTIGAALGTLASLGVNRFIAAQLFGVTPRDPAAIVVALSVLGCMTLIAGYVPARHASRIDPVKALRAE